jgi:hypothetical protein
MRSRPSLTLRFALIVFLGVALADRDGHAQQSPSFAGTWQLNVKKSTYKPGPAPKSGLLKVEYKGAMRHSTLETIAQDGGTTRTEYVAAEDGKDYPLKGSPNADTVALRRSSPGTIERTDKRRGQPVMVLTLRLSPDGKTMTVTQKGVTASGDTVFNTIVYEKR